MSSFIEVKHASVDFVEKKHIFSQLLGRPPIANSALQDVSFTLEKGESVALYGAPGSGKTTLLRLLAGALTPQKGSVLINGQNPAASSHMVDYISLEESEIEDETVHEILHTLAKVRNIRNAAGRVRHVADVLEISPILHRQGGGLSTTERLKVNIAKAALSDAPIVLCDDIADMLGANTVLALRDSLFQDKSFIVSTRSIMVAEELDMPVAILHQGHLLYQGDRYDIAAEAGCPRLVDVWIEELRYDLLRSLRKQAGVLEVQLIPTDQFQGQRLRIRLRSSRYLPSLYDTISQAALVKIDEIPPTLSDIIAVI